MQELGKTEAETEKLVDQRKARVSRQEVLRESENQHTHLEVGLGRRLVEKSVEGRCLKVFPFSFPPPGTAFSLDTHMPCAIKTFLFYSDVTFSGHLVKVVHNLLTLFWILFFFMSLIF